MQDRRADHLCRTLDGLRKIIDKKPIQFAQVLAYVARRPGISYQHLIVLLDLGKATVPRIVDWFCEIGLMEAYDNPENRREKLAYLTPEGKKVVQELLAPFG